MYRHAFTLIELLIAIIAILSVVNVIMKRASSVLYATLGFFFVLILARKNLLRSLLISIGLISAIGIYATAFAQSAQAAASASLSISVIGATGSSFAVGQGWTLTLASTLKNANFSICAINNKGVQSCTPWGTTVGDGSWTGTGTFDETTVGSWTEWVTFPSQSVTSNQIAFTVSQAAATPTSCTVQQLQQGAQLQQGQGTCNSAPTGFQPALWTACFPANPAPAGGYGRLTVQACTQGICEPKNSTEYLNLAGANALASALGATVIAMDNPYGDDATYSEPQYQLLFPNGYMIAAGAVAEAYELGPQPPTTPVAYSSTYVGGWSQLQQAICGPGPATSPNYGAGTGTGSGNTSGTAGSGAGSFSTINSSLNGALTGFSSALSSAAAQASGGTESAAGSAGSAGSASTCASSAATTVASSLQTLQGLTGVLSSGNTDPGVLTSIQNLINAVAQVLSALSKCI